MAKTFRQRVAQAEASARAEELRLQQEVRHQLRGYHFRFSPASLLSRCHLLRMHLTLFVDQVNLLLI